MSKIFKLFKFGTLGALDKLGMFSPTEKAIDLLGQDKFVAEDLLRLDPKATSGTAGLLSKFGKPVQDEMMFTGLEDKILGLPKGEKITSQELKDYLADNKTRVDEIVRSDKLVNKQTNYEPFELDVIEPVGPGRGRYGIGSFLADIDDGVPSALEAFAELDVDSRGANATRLGTLKNPFINKINFEDLSTQFQTNILTPVVSQARKEGLLDPDDFAMAQLGPDIENIIKFEFTPRRGLDNNIEYRIQGNNTIGFEIIGAKQDSDEVKIIGFADSFNEAKLQLDGHRRKKNKVDDDRLKPQHEAYTLPGGTNYQEIILTMPEPIDNVASIAGKYDDLVKKDKFGAIINLNAITGDNSDITLSPQMLRILNDGKVLDLGIDRNIRLNKDTGDIEILKQDYENFSHTADEKNVVVFTRTKDRVDEDGRKILYVEEIQSDMSQQGRRRGLVMGQKEKKAFINRHNNKIFGDILDSIDALKDKTNIADLRGARMSGTTYDDSSIRRLQPSFQDVDFKDTFANFPNVDYESAHSIEDIVKKQMTKYKFNELKDNKVKIFTNRGIDKKSAQKLNIEALTDNIKIPENLYDDVTDYVDMSQFKEKIDAIETVLANKIYTKEFNKRPDMSSVAGKAEFDKLQAFNRDMLKRFMGEKEFNNFMKKETKDIIEQVVNDNIAEVTIPDDVTDLFKYYNSIGDTDIISTPFDGQMTKLEFDEKYLNPKINALVENRLQVHATVTDSTSNRAMGFDYPEDALDEVYDKIKDLQTNLGNAVRYDVKLRPVGNIPSAPFIGSSERFTELAIKRLLKHAKDNDYDGVAFSSGKIHDKRWNQPNLTQYYDVVIPKVAKNLLKGTDAKLDYTDIWLDQESLDEATDMIREGKRYDYFDRDVLNELDQTPALIGHNDGFRGYIGDTPTIYLTDDVKENIDSGISLYSPIIATGVAGTVANKMIGSEEDIIRDEGI